MSDYSEKGFFIKPTRKGVADFEDILAAEYQVKSKEWVKSGWNIFKKDAALSIAFAFLGGVCYLLINFIPFAGILVFYPFIAGFIVISLMVFQNKSLAFKNYFWGFRYSLPQYWRFNFWGDRGMIESGLNLSKVRLYRSDSVAAEELEPPPDRTGGYLDDLLLAIRKGAGYANAALFSATEVCLKAQEASDRGAFGVPLKD